jgi:hypothetical protein
VESLTEEEAINEGRNVAGTLHLRSGNLKEEAGEGGNRETIESLLQY